MTGRLHQVIRAAAVLLACLFAGCSKPAPPTAESTSPSVPAEAASGAFPVSGKAPAAVNGQSSIVLLEARDGRQFPPQDSMPALDQMAKMFTPDFLFVRTGQPVEFRNSDEELHNIDVKEDATKNQEFNVAIITGVVYQHTFPRDGFYIVHCDIHPAMAAVILSTSTPYASQADLAGNFRIDDVAPGAYTVTVYVGAEKLQQPLDVTGPVTNVVVKN